MVGTPYLTLSKTANAARKSANAPQPIFRKPATALRRGPRRDPDIRDITRPLLCEPIGDDYLVHNLIVP
ncbi:hypothetical protein Mro03_45150 [Microbispora rosea subsp. rosea]|nr:hypothetical protein Mro03_45150 [Microbispora rosea subsp. rosea]